VYPGYPAKDVWGCAGPFTATAGAALVLDIVIAPHSSGMPSPGAPTASAANAPGGWIFGSVTRDGAPVAGVTIRLVGTPVTTTTGANGDYQFPAISTADGANGGPTYTVRITPPPGDVAVGAASETVTVQADHGAEADFTLQAVPCRFVLGFQALHNTIPSIVGNCGDNEQHNPANGDALQQTTKGLLVWRKADNFTAFTDGYRTWVSGPDGVRERLNTQRFAWEANPNHLPVVP
jgi:hypothetical protein